MQRMQRTACGARGSSLLAQPVRVGLPASGVQRVVVPGPRCTQRISTHVAHAALEDAADVEKPLKVVATAEKASISSAVTTDAAAGAAAVPATSNGNGNGSSVEAADSEDGAAKDKSDEYSEVMNKRMGTRLHYDHSAGLDFNRILPDIIVGSCLQTAEDVDRLASEEGVTTVYCLQEDCDMEYFSLDLDPIKARCNERGDIKHVRFPIRDFDPFDLRRKLPRAVARLAREHCPERGDTVYIHCTAGMGRAPAVALAYMCWLRGWQLDEAHKLLTSLRRCGPKVEAIRSATADLLLGTEPVTTTIAVYRSSSASRIQVAGLDVGWNAPLDMTWDPLTKRYVLHRELYPGKYMYKLIVDGVWTYSADHPTALDGANINNTLEVIPSSLDEVEIQAQMRYLAQGGKLTPQEYAELNSLLCPWRNKISEGGPCFPGRGGLPPAWASDLSEEFTD